ncbi:uncharacterized protein BDZ99DRAFT_451575 [Mytilinidion resinicola]|uniref:Peptidase C14 caspase domain-containing protein n=1 Tax=Mytilinidion resinicola TaxID=574789 RepID=A0A6A6Y968_9PEZI|nr:uncharacterized protein BDZ99DRAFT_451575 [Mytilinidion resinicola]KAF2804514.1 hypothetical protein BDZ99DRAFT_451575 [Mytilinidion resinicola]
MAIKSHSATTHWAVIVGIDYYPEPKHKCLKGCVRDATTVKLFLETGEPNANIAVLTATAPTDPSFGRPSEEPEVWPTYENFISSLRRVIDMAKSGDFVYIHYSGHGARFSGLAQSELALVLLSEDGRGSRYLRGQTLAMALHKMVEEGIRVTLVLDCCFSGSVVRNSDWHGFDVRCIDYNPIFDAASLQEHSAGLFDVASTLRDSSMEKDWLLSPDGYGILSACAPQEYAYEIEIGNETRGALTYSLLDALSTLRNRGTELTHQSIHEHLSTRFHVSWPRQTPMRYGNENFAFFGNSLLPPDNAFVPIYKTEDDQLCLRAGHIHGVCEGDEYAVYPFDTPEHAQNQEEKALLNVRVNTARVFESELIAIDPTSALQFQMGWKAKPLTSLSPRCIPVKLPASISGNGQLEEIAKGLSFVRLFTEYQTEEPCIFNVIINEHDEYEVVDALHDKVPCVPNISCSSDGSTKALVEVLQHLATFKYFEGVMNRLSSLSFEESFKLTPKIPAGESGAFHVMHDTKWEFTVENSSNKPLYLAIFDFAPSWRIKNLVSGSGGGGYKIIPPRNEGMDSRRVIIGLRMKVPEFLQNCGKGRCEDIIKVFITSKPTFFPLMVLPEISRTADSVFRDIHSGDGLSAFLSTLTTGFRGQDEDAWATQNFIIRTVLE